MTIPRSTGGPTVDAKAQAKRGASLGEVDQTDISTCGRWYLDAPQSQQIAAA
jgi:hypothetical protein